MEANGDRMVLLAHFRSLQRAWQGIQWLSLDGKVRQRLFPQQWARKQGEDLNQELTSDLKRFTSRDPPPKDFVLLKTAGPEHVSTGKNASDANSKYHLSSYPTSLESLSWLSSRALWIFFCAVSLTVGFCFCICLCTIFFPMSLVRADIPPCLSPSNMCWPSKGLGIFAVRLLHPQEEKKKNEGRQLLSQHPLK